MISFKLAVPLGCLAATSIALPRTYEGDMAYDNIGKRVAESKLPCFDFVQKSTEKLPTCVCDTARAQGPDCAHDYSKQLDISGGILAWILKGRPSSDFLGVLDDGSSLRDAFSRSFSGDTGVPEDLGEAALASADNQLGEMGLKTSRSTSRGPFDFTPAIIDGDEGEE